MLGARGRDSSRFRAGPRQDVLARVRRESFFALTREANAWLRQSSADLCNSASAARFCLLGRAAALAPVRHR